MTEWVQWSIIQDPESWDVPNYQNAGQGPRDVPPDDIAARKEIHAKARQMLIIRAMATNVNKVFPVTLRPHTRCYLTGDDPQPLGLIFMRWKPEHTDLVVRQTDADGNTREGVARFAHDRSGKEVGLFMKERWMWHQLLTKYKGLSFGNL